MTDFDYEVLQRKRLAKQSRYVKRGSKSKKCTLPSDSLTAAQLKKRNGEVMSFNLNAPMEWREFKSMPADLQAEYIAGMHKRFGVNATNLAEMFGVTGETVRFFCREGLGIQFHRGNFMSKEQRDRWEDFLTAPESPEPEIETVAETATVEPAPEVSDPTHIDNFIVEFSGMISPESIYNTLRSMLNGRAEGSVTIECKFA